MSFWEKIQKDIKKNLKEGVAIFKEGGAVVSQKLGELTEDGKTRYRIFTLNLKVKDEFAKLGGKVYDLSAKKKSPMTDKGVKAVIARVNKLEAQIAGQETKLGKRSAKKTAKKKKRKQGKKRKKTR